jgi:DUF4097 and DUF4098 domain-containing protein YvlB
MPRPPKLLPAALAALSLVLLANAAGAQRTSDRWLDRCRDGSRYNDDDRYCEVRDKTIPASKTIDVDGRENGGITVHGWDKSEVLVSARIEAHGDSPEEAKDLASQITIDTRDGHIRADGPSRGHRRSWSVSFDLFVPRSSDLSVAAHNGGITVEGVEGRMDLGTVNGGLTLTGVAGDVRGEAVNGGLSVSLDGDRWHGTGLDLRTSNGSVNLSLPRGYSARLETGTTNGTMRIDFPITVQGTIGRRLSTQLGAGGPTIRAITVNGSVEIEQR